MNPLYTLWPHAISYLFVYVGGTNLFLYFNSPFDPHLTMGTIDKILADDGVRKKRKLTRGGGRYGMTHFVLIKQCTCYFMQLYIFII